MRFHSSWVALAGTVLLISTVARAADNSWQVQGGNVTVVAEGNKDLALRAADAILRLRQVVAWEAGWPDIYQPPAVIVFLTRRATFEDYFGKRITELDDYVSDFRSVPGLTAMLGPTAVVIAPVLGGARNDELDAMTTLYVRSLLASGPSANWPRCIQFGLGLAAIIARTTNGDELYIPADAPLFVIEPTESALGPSEIMRAAVPDREANLIKLRRGFSCFALAMASLQDASPGRQPFQKYFQQLAAQVSFEDAARTSLDMDDSALSARIKDFGYRMRSQPRLVAVRVKLPLNAVQWPEPQPLASDRLARTLQALRDKLAGPSMGTSSQ